MLINENITSHLLKLSKEIVMSSNRTLTRAGILILLAFTFLVPVLRAEEETNAVEEVIQETQESDSSSNAFEHIQLMTEVLMKVKGDYVVEKSYKKIIEGAIDGMLTTLDPYSGFLNEKAYAAMKEDTSGQFGGIGIQIGMRHGYLTVIAPIEDTPAYKAGIIAGDIIEKIEGEKTSGESLTEAVEKLRGPKGESVNITILRAGEEDSLEFELVRDDIVVTSIKGGRIIRDDIGYLRITQFSRPTSDMLQKELKKLVDKDMKALVLDLRSNPGGLLSAAIDVSSLFLKKGELVVSTKGRKSLYDNEAKSRGRTHYTDFPMAILVNGGSASASEIVAGALKDHERAIILGGQTFGKGSVQSIRPLASNTNTAVRMTTAYYHTPSDIQIHGVGIKPDIEVRVTRSEWRRIRVRREHLEHPDIYDEDDTKEYEDVIDKPLERAIDLLKGILIFQK